MRNKWVLLVGILLMLGLFGSVGSARAGGWATVTLSELPKEVVAERPFTIEFSVRQHGQTLLAGLSPTVTAVHEASGERVTVTAVDANEEGFYTADLTLPQAGRWIWEIAAFTAVYPMPPLTVGQAAAVTSESGSGTAVGATPVAWQLVLGWMAAAGAVLCLFFWMRQRSQVRLAGVVLLGVVSLVGFALHAQMPTPVLAESEAVMLPAIAPEAMGEALFVAKGCIQCHTNDNVTMAPNLFEVGPDLTFVKRPPEYVALWLANPADLKADTMMPNLHLREAEIETLVDFLKTDAN